MPLFATIFKKSTQPQRHKMLARLTTYSGSIHALAISNDGCILAGGGNLGHNEANRNRSRDPLLWNRPGLYNILATWSHRSGTRDKMVQVLMLNTSAQLQSVFAVQLENTVPKSVAFVDNRTIYVFGLYDGKFMKLEEEDGTIVEEISYKSMIGHAVVHQKCGVFIVGNTTDGFTLYHLEGKGEPLQTFVTALPSVSVPKQVVFGEEGKVVVGGSDNGLAYIFNRKTGQVLGTLHHADAGLVQMIAIHNLDGCCTISCVSPSGQEKTTIKIWVRDYVAQKVSKTPPQNCWSILRTLMFLTQILALLSMSVFLVNSKDMFFDRAIELHQYMTAATMVNAADDFSRHVKAAMLFDNYEYLDMQRKGQMEGPTEGPKNDIRMLHELAKKLMELAEQAGGEIDEDRHKGLEVKDHETNQRVAVADVDRKDVVALILAQYGYTNAEID
ncbi:hypothetical protein P692DRAFT_201807355 [Suillus brevipes Sb2]|nr:hypothetical protein P692DRAFT_201807355 [Suillus brevipes Sb2]